MRPRLPDPETCGIGIEPYERRENRHDVIVSDPNRPGDIWQVECLSQDLSRQELCSYLGFFEYCQTA